jgi:hypothetical protein
VRVEAADGDAPGGLAVASLDPAPWAPAAGPVPTGAVLVLVDAAARAAAIAALTGPDRPAGPAAGDVSTAVSSLRARGLAGDDAFAVGATLRLPVHDRPAREAIATISDLGLGVTAISARPPTLDEVYLQLTGESLAA